MSRCATRRHGCAARHAGFSLVAAIFLIVVLAALGAFAVQIALTQYQGASAELLEARAQAAADAGIEYGANMALQRATCAGTRVLNLAQGALKGFVVTVTCGATTHQVAGATPALSRSMRSRPPRLTTATVSRTTWRAPSRAT